MFKILFAIAVLVVAAEVLRFFLADSHYLQALFEAHYSAMRDVQ